MSYVRFYFPAVWQLDGRWCSTFSNRFHWICWRDYTVQLPCFIFNNNWFCCFILISSVIITLVFFCWLILFQFLFNNNCGSSCCFILFHFLLNNNCNACDFFLGFTFNCWKYCCLADLRNLSALSGQGCKGQKNTDAHYSVFYSPLSN